MQTLSILCMSQCVVLYTYYFFCLSDAPLTQEKKLNPFRHFQLVIKGEQDMHKIQRKKLIHKILIFTKEERLFTVEKSEEIKHNWIKT